jgi:uncharacterized protein YukE
MSALMNNTTNFLMFLFRAMMKANAILLNRSKITAAKSLEDIQQPTNNTGESLEETLKRVAKEQKKFSNFWFGIKHGVEAYQQKRKLHKEKTEFVHNADHVAVSKPTCRFYLH